MEGWTYQVDVWISFDLDQFQGRDALKLLQNLGKTSLLLVLSKNVSINCSIKKHRRFKKIENKNYNEILENKIKYNKLETKK